MGCPTNECCLRSNRASFVRLVHGKIPLPKFWPVTLISLVRVYVVRDFNPSQTGLWTMVPILAVTTDITLLSTALPMQREWLHSQAKRICFIKASVVCVTLILLRLGLFDSPSFLRGQNTVVDAAELVEREKKRAKANELQRVLLQQVQLTLISFCHRGILLKTTNLIE